MITNIKPRQRRRNKTKETILEVARQIIAEKGPDGLSIRELARRIDYSPAGLYEYFASKDEIVAAICAEGIEQFSRYLNNVPADLPPMIRLFQMGLAYLDFAREQPEHFRLMFTDLVAPVTSFEEVAKGDSPYHTLLQAVQAAIEAGQITTQPEYGLNEVAYSLWAFVHGMAMLEQTHLRNFQTDFEALHRQALMIFAAGFQAKQLSAE